ncbi:type I phosphodiesterase/nucleotide pyrophosphatase/phosphate transferase domain-containing protein [Gottschalkia acidurici 9a]|uniref:Type I phosphodiesterase/nucleotide pyrophosphatase/phosphate transferase domain-containing protein n=1 Tax=Gottschalkia acidurici (strain ATCC 7906 / DSM 604 / BCRC 14475 / CIP 104303 / KCTC 5404 / NCIMB 10678 / 9a) TaxID=1128398 RepID=K0AZU7_GOTA9|nr:alkaline phosphatase family protein [Gottschalkia acidurici]AFS77876.1 type I phosphodiesterase/nucleotide pyrophosphatase/phosphate transferase domain-containing protein [Gottschalkia acidurici 9a]
MINDRIKLAITFVLLITSFEMLSTTTLASEQNESRISEYKPQNLRNDLDEEKVDNYVLYINLDGFSYRYYEIANDTTYKGTKNINSLLKDGVLFKNTITGIPSITASMNQSIVSGAWSIDTGNCYRYYDLEKDQVIQYDRDNVLENIAEAAYKNNIKLAAVNAWYFENRGAIAGDKDRLYIQASDSRSSKERFDILEKIIRGEKVWSGSNYIEYKAPPQFMSIYVDDLDTIGHNFHNTYSDTGRAKNINELRNLLVERLIKLDEEIGKIVEALKDRKIYDRTTIVITSDHGMVAYGSDEVDNNLHPATYSSMPDLIDTISNVGQKFIGKNYKVEMVNTGEAKASADTDIILTTVGLQVQVKFREKISRKVLEEIVNSVKYKAYYGTHMYQEDLIKRGTPAKFADLLISPKQPYHFKHNFQSAYNVMGQHDSLDEDAQRVFTMISGANVKHDIIYDEQIYNISMTPLMARLLGFEGPNNATARVIDEVLVDKYKGPILEIINFNGNEKVVGQDTVEIKLKTEKNALVKIKDKVIGNADINGTFNTFTKLSLGLNRLIVQVELGNKQTRKELFVIYVESNENINSHQDNNYHHL